MTSPDPADAPNPALARAGLDTQRVAELNGGVVSSVQAQLERYARFDWRTLGQPVPPTDPADRASHRTGDADR